MYREIQWGRERSTVGFNAGDGVRFYALAQPYTESNITLENDTNINVPGVHVFRVDQDEIYLPSGNTRINTGNPIFSKLA